MTSVPPGFEGIRPSVSFDSFDSPEDHVLENAWCFWYDKFIGPTPSVTEYEASLQKLCTFHTIHEFWKCFNNLPSVEKLQSKSSFHMMRDGIAPLWEDPKVANGGFWTLRVLKNNTTTVWKELILAIIGEQFEPTISEEDEICGLTVSLRQYDDIIRVWNTNASGNANLLARIKELLPDIEFRGSFYKANRDHVAFNQDLHDKKSGINPTSTTSATATNTETEVNGN